MYDVKMTVNRAKGGEESRTLAKFHGSVQDCNISSALAMEILQSCIKPLLMVVISGILTNLTLKFKSIGISFNPTLEIEKMKSLLKALAISPQSQDCAVTFIGKGFWWNLE